VGGPLSQARASIQEGHMVEMLWPMVDRDEWGPVGGYTW
jgi:hypothetical protein